MLQDKERETAMSDLAKRLLNYEGPGMLDPATIKLMREAADEIARLTALEAKLRAEIKRQSDDRRRLRGDLAEALDLLRRGVGILDHGNKIETSAYRYQWFEQSRKFIAARAFLDKGEG